MVYSKICYLKNKEIKSEFLEIIKMIVRERQILSYNYNKQIINVCISLKDSFRLNKVNSLVYKTGDLQDTLINKI